MHVAEHPTYLVSLLEKYDYVFQRVPTAKRGRAAPKRVASFIRQIEQRSEESEEDTPKATASVPLESEAVERCAVE